MSPSAAASRKHLAGNAPRSWALIGALASLVAVSSEARAQDAAPPPASNEPEIRVFFDAASTDQDIAKGALEKLDDSWREGYAAMLVDLARFMRPPREVAVRQASQGGDTDFPSTSENAAEWGAGLLGGSGLDSMQPAQRRIAGPAAKARERLVKFLEKHTGQHFGDDLDAWRRWIWSQPYAPHRDYSVFKAALFSKVDQNMVPFFMAQTQPQIRLDEIEWGGIPVDGIPPLDHPATLAAADASYLADGDVVFGVVTNGEARAYPKRIVAWHEIVRDTLGGQQLALVYCPLCGSAVPYDTEYGGHQYTFGTSGLLYRSNKLMYDAETHSLWSAMEGRPVVGPLAGQKIELRALPIVTTTWQAWKQLHPETTVLSLKTGYERDYGEGVAYKKYFASESPMFPVPKLDDRLKPKDEVVTLLLRPVGQREASRQAMALSVGFLQKHDVHHFDLAGQHLVAVTVASGATRVYDCGEVRFERQAQEGHQLVDASGQTWTVTEGALLPDGRDEAACRRVPARRAFWFGWYAAFPQTGLVK